MIFQALSILLKLLIFLQLVDDIFKLTIITMQFQKLFTTEKAPLSAYELKHS